MKPQPPAAVASVRLLHYILPCQPWQAGPQHRGLLSLTPILDSPLQWEAGLSFCLFFFFCPEHFGQI